MADTSWTGADADARTPARTRLPMALPTLLGRCMTKVPYLRADRTLRWRGVPRFSGNATHERAPS